MSEKSGGEAKGEPKAIPLKWALRGVAVLGVAGIVYIIAQASINPQRETNLKSLATGEMAKFVTPLEAAPAPVNSFQDPTGAPKRIADFKGKPVEIVAISVDRPDDADKARAFIAKHAPLAFYHDPKMALPFAFKPTASGMPTTIIYGADGVERGRLAGGADWGGKDAKALIDKVLAES